MDYNIFEIQQKMIDENISHLETEKHFINLNRCYLHGKYFVVLTIEFYESLLPIDADINRCPACAFERFKEKSLTN